MKIEMVFFRKIKNNLKLLEFYKIDNRLVKCIIMFYFMGLGIL